MLAVSCGGSSAGVAILPVDVSTTNTYSPILSELGIEGSSQSVDELQEIEHQEQVARCMRDDGFTYYPEPVITNRSGSFDNIDPLEPGKRESVAVFGFGISTTWFSMSQLPPEVLGADYDLIVDSLTGGKNATLYDSLSLDEQAAYNSALNGPVDGSEEGCIQRSRRLLQADKSGDVVDWAGIGMDLVGIWESIEYDERVTDFREQGRSCMANDGYDWISEAVYIGNLVEELEDIEDSLSDPFEALRGENLDSLIELQRLEVEVALAAFDCRASEVFVSPLLDLVRIEYEQEYVDTHQLVQE